VVALGRRLGVGLGNPPYLNGSHSDAAKIIDPSDDWFNEADGFMKDIKDKLLFPETLRADHSAVESVRQRLFALLQGRSAGAAAKSLRQMAERRSLSVKAAKAVERCAGYLVKHTRWLHYDRALADGLPISTGVIKGTQARQVTRRPGTGEPPEPGNHRNRDGWKEFRCALTSQSVSPRIGTMQKVHKLATVDQSCDSETQWEKPTLRAVPLAEMQANWPRLLSVESSLYASGCHQGRIFPS
jgi:hypothetical protein